MAVGNIELTFPLPGTGYDRTLRVFTFLDAGNVWGDPGQGGTSSGANGLRYGYGVGLAWISPIGPLKLSLGFPLHEARGRPVPEVPVPDRYGVLIGVADRSPNNSIERITLLTGMFSKRVACGAGAGNHAGRRSGERSGSADRRGEFRPDSAGIGGGEGGPGQARGRVREARQVLADMAQKLEVDVRIRSTRTVRRCRSADSRAKAARSVATRHDFQRKQREVREDLNQRRNEELAAVLDRANKVIKQIAEAQH